MQTSKSSLVTLMILIAIIAFGIWYVAGLNDRSAARELASSPATKSLGSDKSASAFTTLDGDSADLDQYLGQVLIVTSWASWAPASQNQLQLLADVAAQYSVNDVVFIGINRGEAADVARSYLASIGVQDKITLVLDPDDSYYRSIEGFNMPETVFYDSRGGIISHERGRLAQEVIVSNIERGLATK